jgi:spore maturation protein CgeB
MKLVIFGLAVSSSWGNGHATLWRGMCAALARRGHKVVFFERDVPYYASTRDLFALRQGELILYENWDEIAPTATRQAAEADVVMVTSYCPDAASATVCALNSSAEVRCFYDLDTPVTLDRLEHGLRVAYIGPRGLQDFDLVLSYAGGAALKKVQDLLGAKAVAALYGSVDPDTHFPVAACDAYRADLSYLGTFAADRQIRLESLLVEPAKRFPRLRFLIGGSMYDGCFPRQPNIFMLSHVAPAKHPAFYCSAKLNLNVTRQAMADNGYCPSGRLFEAAACGAAILSDWWEGLDTFFESNSEILLAETTEEAIDALERSPEELTRIGRAAREKVLERHTADARVSDLENILSTFRQCAMAGVS